MSVKMWGRWVVFCCCIVHLTEARVDFTHSRIYDEFDFQGQSSVIIDGLCKDSCHIYASITEESKKLASNILIQTSKSFVSVADIAALIDPLTKRKAYFEVIKTASLTIANANSQLAAGPLVMYVVNQAGDFFSTAEIYEANGFHRPVSTFVPAVTVMSARPFTLTQARHEGALAASPQSVFARMAGFDALGEAPTLACYNLYYLEYGPFPGFTLDVNGPIVSVSYNYYNQAQFQVPPGDLTATIGITNMRDLERCGWMGSPGFHGCTDKQPYRSSLYDFTSWFHGEIASEKQEFTFFNVVTNTNETNPVVIRDRDFDGIDLVTIDDTSDSPYGFGYGETARNWTINWMPDGTDNKYFMIRWNSSIVPL